MRLVKKTLVRIMSPEGGSFRSKGQEEGGMDYRKKFFVDPDEKLRLQKLDPGYKGDHESEETAKQETEAYLLTSRLCCMPSESTRC